MLELNEERATSRAAHDSPVIPPTIWDRRGISESDYELIRQDKAIRKDNAIRAEANAVIARAISRITEYQNAARASVADMPLVRHYAYRYGQLRDNVGKLTAELLLARDNTINPQKTIVFYTALIRDLLNTPVEMPKSSIRIMDKAEYRHALNKSRAMSPGVYPKPNTPTIEAELLPLSEWERLDAIAREKQAKTA